MPWVCTTPTRAEPPPALPSTDRCGRPRTSPATSNRAAAGSPPQPQLRTGQHDLHHLMEPHLRLQNVTFQLGAGFEHIRALHVFHSAFDNSTTEYCSYLGFQPVVNGSIQLVVFPNTMYTLSTVNGTRAPSRPLPLPGVRFPSPTPTTLTATRCSRRRRI